MLISYPVLPAAAVHDDEDIYLAHIIEGHLLQYEGSYPVSTVTTPQGDVHRWHGGVHLHGGGERIRAIADGTVVAFRFGAQRETYGTLGDYDTSFVLLRHETQTGENTPVVFYSLYMHLANQGDLAADRLSQLPMWLRQNPGPAIQRPANQRIWRKDVLGFAGQLYNREAMHFEVFMLDADFQRVWRDSSAITEGTGSNDWFGDAHFVIPPQRPFAERHPRAVANGAHRIDFPGSTDFPLPIGRDGQNEYQLFVSVSLQRGRRIATTYSADGRGGFEQIGAPVVQDDYEYELYRLATALYPDCPSAGFEWLRFGRVLGNDTTTRNENWQLIRYGEDPQAIGYIDLAPQAIAKLSDADFPHWHGWERRDEGDTDLQPANASDGICDDEYTLGLVREARGSDAHAARKLQHLICKAPSEWDDSDLAMRYARMRAPGQPLESDDNWQRFVDHAGKLAFWSQAGLAERSVWHFHPLRFVRQFRNCGWRSRRELLQLVPQNIIRKPGSHNSASQGHWESPPLGPANALLSAHMTELNRALRKFCIDTPIRQACFFGNSVQETQWFRYLRESNGGQPTLHQGWYGRGFLQLTNPNGAINNGNNNYYRYFRFLGRAPVAPPGTQETAWRDQIGADAYHAAHSAGAYWVWPNKSAPTSQSPNLPQVDSANKYADVHAPNQRRTISTTSAGVKNWYYNQSFTNCAAAVNFPATVTQAPPNMNGLVDRSVAFANALMVLHDVATFPDEQGIVQSTPLDFTRRIVT